MDSIDIELCRRPADLAVFFLIELISRFLKPRFCSFDSSSASSRSGKQCCVIRRHACNGRLQAAIYHWSRVAPPTFSQSRNESLLG